MRGNVYQARITKERQVMTKATPMEKQAAEHARPEENAVAARHHEPPTKASWEAFLAQRRALYTAQLEAVRRK